MHIAIYRANTLLEEVADLEGATVESIERISAEAKFIRALCHYHVVRIWALPYGYTSDNSHLGIPLKLSADQTPNARYGCRRLRGHRFASIDAEADLPADNGIFVDQMAAKGSWPKCIWRWAISPTQRRKLLR